MFREKFFQIEDAIISEITMRFNDQTIEPLFLMERIIKGAHLVNDLDTLERLNFYNHLIDFNQLQKEMLTWKHSLNKLQSELANDNSSIKWQCKINSISFITKLFVDKHLVRIYPQMMKLMQIFLTVPMTSVSAERTFSALKRIKTYLRNTMHQDRLSNLAIIHIEKEITSKLSKEKIIDQFCSIKSRHIYIKIILIFTKTYLFYFISFH
jgi:hypothetical protein